MDTNTLKIKRNVPLDLNRNSMMRKGPILHKFYVSDDKIRLSPIELFIHFLL